MDEDGECLVETTARSHQLDAICKKMDDGKYRVVLYSTERVLIEPGDGAILKIKVDVKFITKKLRNIFIPSF